MRAVIHQPPIYVGYPTSNISHVILVIWFTIAQWFQKAVKALFIPFKEIDFRHKLLQPVSWSHTVDGELQAEEFFF